MSRRGNQHIDRDTLLEYAGGALRPPPSLAHLERCPGCAERLEALEDLVRALRAEPDPPPPPQVLQRAIALFPRRPRLAARVVEAVARLVAGADQLRLAAAAGVRGAPALPVRLAFAGAGLEVDLELAEEDAGVRVTAQVMAAEGAELPLLAWAEREGSALGVVPLSDHGVFVLERLPAGPLDLVLEGGAKRLRIRLRAVRA